MAVLLVHFFEFSPDAKDIAKIPEPLPCPIAFHEDKFGDCNHEILRLASPLVTAIGGCGRGTAQGCVWLGKIDACSAHI